MSSSFLRLASSSMHAAIALVVAAACSGLGDGDGTDGLRGLEDGGGSVLLDGGLSGEGGSGGSGATEGNPLCGENLCERWSTDLPTPCEGYDASVPGSGGGAGGVAAGGSGGGGGGTGGAGGTGGEGGVAGEGGVGGEGGFGGLGGFGGEPDAGVDGAVDASLDGGVDGAVEGGSDGGSSEVEAGWDAGLSAETGAGGAGGAGPTTDASVGDAPEVSAPPVYPTQPTVFACQVVVEDVVRRRCAPAGSGGSGAPCTSGRDCAPGFACVGEQTGQCLKYCCESESTCADGTWCADRPMRTLEPHDPAPLVPVCVPGDGCRIDEPEDCDPATSTCCPDGQACFVVRVDGTTACREVGDGESGDPCPCAVGYYCSDAKTCIRTCKTDGTAGQCGDGRCQATAGFPAGTGLCVGSASR